MSHRQEKGALGIRGESSDSFWTPFPLPHAAVQSSYVETATGAALIRNDPCILSFVEIFGDFFTSKLISSANLMNTT